MSSSKKNFAAGVYLSESPFPPMTPYPPYTLHSEYLFTQSGGGVELTREKVRGAPVHKVGSKIPTRLTVSPVYKL